MNTQQYQEKRVQELLRLEELQKERGDFRHSAIEIQRSKIGFIKNNLEEEIKILELLEELNKQT